MLVKICGIRAVEAAQTAVDAGADFLGFNFVPSSKRYITPEKAKEIITGISGNIQKVGVFQDEDLERVNEIAKDLALDIVQLHGNEDTTYCLQVEKPVINVFTVESYFENDTVNDLLEGYITEYIMFDRRKEENAGWINPEKIYPFTKKHNVFLAGGLTPENVSDVIAVAKPYAVDVASGVETNGEQDYEKMRLFIQNAKGERI